MFKSRFEIFLAKRVLFVTIILILVDLVFVEQRWFVLLGLLVGSVLSIFKLCSYVLIFSKIILPKSGTEKYKHGVSKSVLNFIVNQIVVLLLLSFSYIINPWLFMGIVSGVLLTPLVIMINCFTEAFKITHNNFE